MHARKGFGAIGLAMMAGLSVAALHGEPAGIAVVLAQGTEVPLAQPNPAEAAPQDNSPEAIMNRRFPQKVKVGDLIGLPVLDDNDVTLGRVQRVVHTPEGKIKLIVGYSKWFGWFGRPVAVPIEVVAILGPPDRLPGHAAGRVRSGADLDRRQGYADPLQRNHPHRRDAAVRCGIGVPIRLGDRRGPACASWRFRFLIAAAPAVPPRSPKACPAASRQPVSIVPTFVRVSIRPPAASTLAMRESP